MVIFFSEKLATYTFEFEEEKWENWRKPVPNLVSYDIFFSQIVSNCVMLQTKDGQRQDF